MLTDIKRFKVAVKQFKLAKLTNTQTIAPEDAAYVDEMMAREKEIANQLLLQSSHTVADEFQKQLLKTVSEISLDTEKLDQLLQENWQQPIHEKIQHDETSKAAQRLQEAQASRQTAYEEAIQQENEQLRDQMIQQETNLAVKTQQTYIDQEVQALQQKARELAQHKLVDAMVSKQKQADQIMAEQFKSMVDGLNKMRQKFIVEHTNALEKLTVADDALAERQRAEVAQHDVVQLENRKHALETEQQKLQSDLVAAQGEAQQWQTQAEGSHDEIDRLTKRVSELSQSDNQTALIAALIGQKDEPQPSQPAKNQNNHSYLKGALISAAVLLNIGGIGYGVVYANNQKAQAADELKAVKASYHDKQVALDKKQQKQSSKATSTSSNRQSLAIKDETLTTPQSQITDYSTLDKDVAYQSLQVYTKALVIKI